MDKNKNSLVYILIALIIGFSIVVAVYINNQMALNRQSQKLMYDKQQEANKITQLQNCYQRVQASYLETWNNRCELEGQDIGCLLPHQIADSLDKGLANNRKQCEQLYTP